MGYANAWFDIFSLVGVARIYWLVGCEKYRFRMKIAVTNHKIGKLIETPCNFMFLNVFHVCGCKNK